MGDLPLFRGNRRSKKGRYTAKNPKKYIGDSDRIFYRSGLERKVCVWCDNSPEVIAWGSETIKVPYRCPFSVQMKIRTYYVDFVIRIKNKDGTKCDYLVEVKPQAQLKFPKKTPKKSRRRLFREMRDYYKNQAKFKYAILYAKKMDMEYVIWSEKTLKQKGIS